MLRAAIFDLDGTLVDSLPGIEAALNGSLAEHGYPTHSRDRVQSFIGNGSWKLCWQALPEASRVADTDAVHAGFLRIYDRTWKEGTELYPGITEMLAELKSNALPLAILSNKPHPFTVDIVAHLFAGIFDQVLGHREDAPRKPDPAGALEIAAHFERPPDEIAFVGDSTVDYETARNAGMAPLLVNWGYHSEARLRETSATLIRSTAELLKHLQEPHRAE